MTKKKVYCSNCKYYFPARWDGNKEDHCLIEKIIKDNYLQSYNIRWGSSPAFKNENNNCPDFEGKLLWRLKNK